MSEALASIIIRAKNEAPSIGQLVRILRAQTVAERLELIVVDSGSTDGTPAITRELGVPTLQIPAESFSFGGALNVGCTAASSDVLIALSAHAFPRDERWAERMIASLDDSRVACASGEARGPDGVPLSAAVLQDLPHVQRHPFWGYSNGAGAFRASLWRQRPWREDMPGTEDKEWAHSWLERGWLVCIDPALTVDHDHSHDSLPSVFERCRREWRGYGMYLDIQSLSIADGARLWWNEVEGYRSPLHARLSPWHAARVAGQWAGRRR